MNRIEPRGPKTAASTSPSRHVFVRNLVLPASIGIHRHEQDHPQRVRVNLDLAVDDEAPPAADALEAGGAAGGAALACVNASTNSRCAFCSATCSLSACAYT